MLKNTSARIYSYSNWLDSFTANDLLHTLNDRQSLHELDNIYDLKRYLSYPVGYKLLTAIDLLHNPTLAKILRKHSYPIYGELIQLPEDKFSQLAEDDHKGIDSLIDALLWLKEKRHEIYNKKLAFDHVVNHLLHLYENDNIAPKITHHKKLIADNGYNYATQLTISDLPYLIFNCGHNISKFIKNENKSYMECINIRDLLQTTNYRGAYSIILNGYIENTSWLCFHVRQRYANKGHAVWLNLDNEMLTRSVAEVKESAQLVLKKRPCKLIKINAE